MLNKRNSIISAAVGIVWGIALFFVFPQNEFGQWFALALSTGGMAFGFYNYLTWIDKLMRGELDFDFVGMLNGVPH